MFKGSIVAIVTPMKENGEIDYDAFSDLLEWHIQSKTDGLVILGTTGESATINLAEREKLIHYTVDCVNNRIPIIVGTGTNCTQKTIEYTEHARELGADAALVVTPYYNKPTQAGLLAHYMAVAKAASFPLILYNVPSRTACDLLPETVVQLAKLSNVVGIKEATGKIDRVEAIVKSGCEITVFGGDDATGLALMEAGGKGVISVVANVAPLAFHEMCCAALAGDSAKANAIDKKLQPLYKALFVESNPIPTKWVLQEMGKIAGGIRLPLTVLEQPHQATVREAMQQAGV